MALTRIKTDQIANGQVKSDDLDPNISLPTGTGFADNSISGNSIDGGTISNFASTGIDDNATATAVTIDSAGNVGVGTATPNRKLIVAGRTGITSETGTGVADLRFTNDSGNFWIGIDNSAASAFARGNYGRVIWSEGNYPLSFTTNSGERMRITSAGNVGIGTSSPVDPLHVFTSTSDKGIISHNAAFANVRIQSNRTGTNDNIGGLTFVRNDEVGVSQIRGVRNGDLLFITGSDSGNQERMRITSAGNVGIGVTSLSAKLEVRGSTDGVPAFIISGDNGPGSPSIRTNTLRFVDLDAFSSSNTVQQAGRIEFFTSDLNNPGVNSFIEGQTVSTDGSGALLFGTGIGSATERARIDTSGNLLVGTTTNTNSSRLVVNGTISETVGGTQYAVLSQYDVGTALNQVPLNQYLGSLAYQNAESVNIDNLFVSGNVGIGTALPSDKFSIDGGSLIIRSGVSSAASASNAFAITYDTINGSAYLQARSTGGNTDMRFITSSAGVPSTRMLINSVGDIGIGGSPAGVRLDIAASAAAGSADVLAIRNSATAETGAAARMFFMHGSGGPANATVSAGIYSFVTQTSPVFAGDLRFITNSGASSSEKMRIDSSGNIGVNTSTPTARLHVVGDIKSSLEMYSDGGDISINNGVTTTIKTLSSSFNNTETYMLSVIGRGGNNAWRLSALVFGGDLASSSTFKVETLVSSNVTASFSGASLQLTNTGSNTTLRWRLLRLI
jgi:hypothetical protein